MIQTADQLLARLHPALSPAARSLLEPLLRHAELAHEPGTVVCTFSPCEGDEEDLAFRQLRIFDRGQTPPPGVPECLRALLEVCGGLEMGTQGNTGALILHDGFSGTLHTVGGDAWNARACGFAYDPSVCAPIDVDLQGFYFVHPTSGRLCFHDSEGTCDVVRGTSDSVEIYLREVHARAVDYDWQLPLPEGTPSGSNAWFGE